MIWLTWRQHRLSILGAVAGLAALAFFLVLSGNGMRHSFDHMGLNQCARPLADSCPDLADQFQHKYSGLQFVLPLFLIIPALVGVFWGAPLVARELEQGTYRLVWTQSITRRRWLGMKVAFFAVAILVVLGAATRLLIWWSDPLMTAWPQRFSPGFFDLLGVVPIAYAFAAFAIGVAAGTVTRRLVMAIAITLVAFVVVRVGVELVLRPHYMSALTTSVDFEAQGDRLIFPKLPDGWVISSRTITADGRPISDGVGIEFDAINAACPEVSPQANGNQPPPKTAMAACAQRLGFHVVATYQPAGRFWRFQLTESAIYLVLSGVLLAGSAWWLRRRTV